MKKAFSLFLSMLSISAIISFLSVTGFLMATEDMNLSKVDKSVRTQMNSTCKVFSKAGATGSGVLLNSGVILTAAHVVDDNNNGKLDLAEREVMLEFFGDSQGFEVMANVLLINSNIDYAVIQTSIKEGFGADLAPYGPRIGEEVYTVGCARGFPPVISEGRTGDTAHGSRRTSCYILTGNSGGALYKKETGDVIGLMTQVDVKTVDGRFMYTFFANENLHMGFARGPIHYEQNGLSIYASVSDISSDLKSRNALFLLERKKDEFRLNPHLFNLAVTLIVMGICVWKTRRHILG